MENKTGESGNGYHELNLEKGEGLVRRALYEARGRETDVTIAVYRS